MASYYLGLSLLSNKRQKSAEGRRILSLLELSLDGRPLEENDIIKENNIIIEENGRPYFSDRHSDFNISHSGNMTAVSLVRGENLRTGCDVQLLRPRSNIRGIAEGFFSAAEREYIFSSQKTQNETEKFFRIWVLKECYLKLRGLSVFDMQKAPSFIGEAGRFAFNSAVSSPLSFYLYELAGPGKRYMLASAAEGALETQPGIRWFSQPELSRPAAALPPLSVKSIAEIKGINTAGQALLKR